ncbi:hypothetical protein [Undibacterium sp. TJN19]|uniref:hypothetical protein n=1 Tax=Undibacterium sp. TJN19 TaxID=3413055 RepID=UPI003BF06FFE
MKIKSGMVAIVAITSVYFVSTAQASDATDSATLTEIAHFENPGWRLLADHVQSLKYKALSSFIFRFLYMRLSMMRLQARCHFLGCCCQGDTQRLCGQAMATV